MTEKEYIKLIPEKDITRVKELLKMIDKVRGWGATGERFEAVWRLVSELAKQPQHGNWTEQFKPEDLSDDNVAQLASLIEQHFLGGVISAHLEMKGKPAVQFRVLDSSPDGENTWISLFGKHNNIIYLLRPKWCQRVSEDNPYSSEGVLCTSRLQVLMHTLAHEMVHAAVFHMFPDIDRASPAYLADDCHGPIFLLMNKRMFGHGSESYRPIFMK